MNQQRHRKFIFDEGKTLQSVSLVQETDSTITLTPATSKLRPVAIRTPLVVRIKENILAQSERNLLDWLSARRKPSPRTG